METIKKCHWHLANYDMQEMNAKFGKKDAYIYLRDVVLEMAEEVNFELGFKDIVMEVQIDEESIAVLLWDRSEESSERFIILERFDMYFTKADGDFDWANNYANANALEQVDNIVNILESMENGTYVRPTK